MSNRNQELCVVRIGRPLRCNNKYKKDNKKHSKKHISKHNKKNSSSSSSSSSSKLHKPQCTPECHNKKKSSSSSSSSSTSVSDYKSASGSDYESSSSSESITTGCPEHNEPTVYPIEQKLSSTSSSSSSECEKDVSTKPLSISEQDTNKGNTIVKIPSRNPITTHIDSIMKGLCIENIAKFTDNLKNGIYIDLSEGSVYNWDGLNLKHIYPAKLFTQYYFLCNDNILYHVHKKENNIVIEPYYVSNNSVVYDEVVDLSTGNKYTLLPDNCWALTR